MHPPMPNCRGGRGAIILDGRRISLEGRPYFVAEISANLGGRLAPGLKVIDAARCSAASAVKLQTYRPDIVSLDSAVKVVTADAVRRVRPGHGVPPKRLDELIGRTLARAVRAKTATREEELAG